MTVARCLHARRCLPALVLAALETGESGSLEAAPMVRRILEAYIGGALVTAAPKVSMAAPGCPSGSPSSRAVG